MCLFETMDEYSILNSDSKEARTTSFNVAPGPSKRNVFQRCIGPFKTKCLIASCACNLLFICAIVFNIPCIRRCSTAASKPAQKCDVFEETKDACNFGPAHHAHILLPLVDTKRACMASGAKFFLSHGATFFCPHAFDVKLLVTLKEEESRRALCTAHFESVEAGTSSKVVLRQTLPAGALPAMAQGRVKTWSMSPMYHIHTFGKTINDGSSHGWNLTSIRSEETTVYVERVLYSRKLDVEPKPANLTYLAHYGGDDGKAILSHYLATSGSSGFAHILKASLTISGQGSTPVPLRSTWATFITIDGRIDDLSERLNVGDADVSATLHTYDVKTGLPNTVAIKLTVTFDYYFGAHDGFVGYTRMCAQPPPYPQSPTACGMPDI